MPSPSLTLLRTQSDDRLVALARDGHERAFEAIVERYRRPLLRAARRVLPEARAEDALQQALIAAWTALQRGDEVRDLRAWLYRVVHNTSLNALRVNGYDYVELEDTLRLTDAGDEELERRAVVRQTLASLAALPDRQREALLRTAVSGYSQEEVARDLGISHNAMRQLIHRARVSLRAAATSLTPLPLITALASGSRGGPLVERIAELAAPAGASVTLAKAGTVVILAGGALSGPAIVHRVENRPPHVATAAAASSPGGQRPARARKTASPSPTPAPVVVRAKPVARNESLQRPVPKRRRSGPSRAGHGGEADHSDSGSGTRDRHSGSGTDDGSGSGSGDTESVSGGSEGGSGETGSGTSGSGSGDLSVDHSGGGDDSAESHSGSGHDRPVAPLAVTPQPTATPAAEESGSGHGADDDPEAD